MKQDIQLLLNKKLNHEKITFLTCYDYSFGTVLESTGLDMILVGDSGSMVIHGNPDTTKATMDDMLAMAKSVRRGAPSKFIVGDMPKDSYESSNEIAVNNALRFINEAGCDAVKLEGGAIMCDRVKAIRASGIQIMGHIGLTPQSASTFGGYRVVGRSESEKTNLVKDFNELKMAGAFAVLLEAVPPSITKEIVKNSTTIVLGIGAGVEADGQLLIIHDLLGLYPDFRPKFAKNFIIDVIDQFSKSITTQEDIVEFGRKTRKDGIHELSRLAVEKYISDCKSKKFPSLEYTYKE